MKWGALANPDARRRLAKTALSGIAADKAAGTVYDIINQSINQSIATVEEHSLEYSVCSICCRSRPGCSWPGRPGSGLGLAGKRWHWPAPAAATPSA